jgi:Mn2+/Fe2+ NRAMP family transporter
MGADTNDEMKMSMNPKIERDREIILTGKSKGLLGTVGAYLRLSGPGWLQSAITLGGGSLSSSMYLGVLVGFAFLWLQPLAMVLGVIMLSSIAYVSLSTGKRPFRAINEHINPVMGWAWLISSMMANLVWSMPQFALGTAAMQQNLFPSLIGPGAMPDPWGKIVAGGILLAVSITFVMLYTAGGKGVKAFEIITKLMVGTIVICFFGVVIKLSANGMIDWGAIAKGFVPRISLAFRPADGLLPFIQAVDESFRGFWFDLIVAQQRDVMISAASTAVGINMTFLLPYSMLRKGWNRDFRGLAIFDLSTGLFIPFVLTTGCVVIAAASQFHAVPSKGFLGEVDAAGQRIKPAPNLVASYDNLMRERVKYEIGAEAMAAMSPDAFTEKVAAMKDSLPEAERIMAAVVVKRDAFNLADAIAPLVGTKSSRYFFGIGITGMALGAITMLMLINGLCLCEVLNVPPKGWPQRIGCLMVSVGVLGPFFWSGAQMWLAMPTSVFAMVLLPIAYCSFYMLLNQKKLLGDDMPRGGRRVLWNTLMAIAVAGTTFMSLYSILTRGPVLKRAGLIVLVGFIALATIAHFRKKAKVSDEG